MTAVQEVGTATLQQSDSLWEYTPGLLELMDEGMEPGDFASRDFVVPRVPELAHGNPGFAPEGGSLQRFTDWLRGFRFESTLFHREPVWIPIAEVWAPRGGKAEFSYQTSAERELQAEITVFSVIGVGGSSKRTLDTNVTLPVSRKGVIYETRAFLTVHRYYKASSNKTLYRVDVDCSGATGEFQSRELDARKRPFSGIAQTEQQLREAGYDIARLERRSAHSQNSDVTIRNESRRSWKFEVSPEIPGLDAPLKLGANCERAKSFETKFTLPGGRDYAFCALSTEAPVVPFCVDLA